MHADLAPSASASFLPRAASLPLHWLTRASTVAQSPFRALWAHGGHSRVGHRRPVEWRAQVRRRTVATHPNARRRSSCFGGRPGATADAAAPAAGFRDTDPLPPLCLGARAGSGLAATMLSKASLYLILASEASMREALSVSASLDSFSLSSDSWHMRAWKVARSLSRMVMVSPASLSCTSLALLASASSRSSSATFAFISPPPS
mmetsp:Transcript_34932/g.85030  ORF Transcript_34932/g.85030 Transcript_34932/m.85030 type:complete len:205 (-) Transcript_34932:64-678(-)